ncbi:DUF1795 domain-containing protein [Pseudomonas sp. v388]|uniref:DcrB-related protein n=1 Tax=Pseudomonas sp. v388 TaxID=2479849 RepID=UPI000F782DBF|nr:DcrB-related protein [Pseudomonas sp. v388]RRV03878.1 DUF1795 domain-containing protein [Pseudomonas sp. v388]
MTYRINELQFQLPESELQDASINILKFPTLGTSLIISRSVLAEGETLQSNFDDQLKRLEKQVQDLRYQQVQNVRIAADQAIDAIEMRSQFSKGTENVYQLQLAFVQPGTRKMIALSYVKAQPLGEPEANHWAVLKQTLTFA